MSAGNIKKKVLIYRENMMFPHWVNMEDRMFVGSLGGAGAAMND